MSQLFLLKKLPRSYPEATKKLPKKLVRMMFVCENPAIFAEEEEEEELSYVRLLISLIKMLQQQPQQQQQRQ